MPVIPRARRSAPPTAAVAVAVAIGVGLGGCAASTPGDPAASGEPAAPSSAPAPDLAACLLGSWEANLPDLARQMTDDFALRPLATDTTARVEIDGTLVLRFADDGRMEWGGPVDYVVTALGEEVSMEISVETRGAIAGSWSVVGDRVALTGVDRGGWSTTSRVTVNDVPLDDPSFADGLIDPALRDGDVVASCSDDSLLTQSNGSPFLTSWSRMS